MRRLAFGILITAALCSTAYLFSPESSAQTAASCPTGFSEVGVQSPDPLDLNLDGLACASEANVGSNGIGEVLLVENGVQPCACPPGFIGPLPNPAAPASVDRNDDGKVCTKGVPPPDVTPRRFVFIDNRRCNP